MCRNIPVGPKSWQTAMLCAFIILVSASAMAQSPVGDSSRVAQPAAVAATPSPTPRSTPVTSPERDFLKNILRDQRAIWTSPFHLERDDARWVVPLLVSTGALIATDRKTAGELAEDTDNRSRLRISRDISYIGSYYTTGALSAAFYLIGRSSRNARARETGVLGAEALINGVIVASALKAISQRPRPRVDNASGEFFDGGASFPSGHAISAWSMATIIAYEYGQHRPLLRVGVYGLATAISLARFTSQKHFLSDALVGSAIGYGIGRYVYRKHHDPALETNDSYTQSERARSKLVPFASPLFNRATRSYGLALAWNF
jgi:membrane-associated phospholipid phosphatase